MDVATRKSCLSNTLSCHLIFFRSANPAVSQQAGRVCGKKLLWYQVALLVSIVLIAFLFSCLVYLILHPNSIAAPASELAIAQPPQAPTSGTIPVSALSVWLYPVPSLHFLQSIGDLSIRPRNCKWISICKTLSGLRAYAEASLGVMRVWVFIYPSLAVKFP